MSSDTIAPRPEPAMRFAGTGTVCNRICDGKGCGKPIYSMFGTSQQRRANYQFIYCAACTKARAEAKAKREAEKLAIAPKQRTWHCDHCNNDTPDQKGSSQPMRGFVRQWWCGACTAAARAGRKARAA